MHILCLPNLSLQLLKCKIPHRGILFSSTEYTPAGYLSSTYFSYFYQLSTIDRKLSVSLKQDSYTARFLPASCAHSLLLFGHGPLPSGPCAKDSLPAMIRTNAKIPLLKKQRDSCRTFSLNRLETAFQILNDVINVLCSDGQTDGIAVNTLLVQFFFRQLRMGGGSRMDHQGLHIRYIC